MNRKSGLWISLYLFLLCVVVFSVYIGVHIFFNEPFSDPVFSRLPITKSLGTAKKTPESNRPVPSDLNPSVFKRTEETRYVIERFDQKDPIYTVKMQTTGSLTESAGMLRGRGIIPFDPKKRTVPFTVSGEKKYVLGIHKAVFKSNPSTLEELTGPQIIRRIPAGTLIQIRIAPFHVSDKKEEGLLTYALESIGAGTFDIDGVTFPAYGIEIAE